MAVTLTSRRYNNTHSLSRHEVNIPLLDPLECAAATRKRIHLLISGRVDCRADQAPYTNPLTELVDWLEGDELRLDAHVHLMVELRQDIPTSLAEPLILSFERLRRRWGERRVKQWLVSASPLLSAEQLLRDHPRYKSMRPCSWPTVYNTLSAAYKVASLTRGLLACPSDLVLRLRPNAAVDLRPAWPLALKSLASGCDVLTPEQEGNGGVNDNFALLSVRGLSRYAAAYASFEALVQRRGCMHPESLVKDNLQGLVRHCALPVLFWPRACMGYAELAMLAAGARGAEESSALRERIVGKTKFTWAAAAPPPPMSQLTATVANHRPVGVAAARASIPVG